jgi:hypothetical protein
VFGLRNGIFSQLFSGALLIPDTVFSHFYSLDKMSIVTSTQHSPLTGLYSAFTLTYQRSDGIF